MIEIIPNWHPFFVHFTVGLFSTSVAFYTLSYLTNKLSMLSKLATDFQIVAQWCLWVAGVAVIGTVLAGFYAFNTVNHDPASHLAMTVHRNWAIPTAVVIILLALWSLWRTQKHMATTLTFIVALYVGQGLLLSTAWHGAEVVFRYGIGVMSLPKSEGIGHGHHEGMTKMPEMIEH